MNTSKKNILIIGASNVGKTHFGGQLYGRLDEQNCSLKLREQPESLSVFKEVWEKLNNGLLGAHTPSNQNTKIVFPVEDKNGNNIDIIYPDYAGEQILQIVKQRHINSQWVELIKDSDDWFLFIRPSLIDPIVDVTTKFYDQIGEDNEDETKTKNQTIEIKDSNPIFYIELLQMFLFVKGVSSMNNNKTQLTILLSCYDEMEKQKPERYFKEKMPMLYNFINAVWKNKFNIYGLSSLGQSLTNDKPDNDFAIDGPENRGYFIRKNDLEEISDITQIFS